MSEWSSDAKLKISTRPATSKVCRTFSAGDVIDCRMLILVGAKEMSETCAKYAKKHVVMVIQSVSSSDGPTESFFTIGSSDVKIDDVKHFAEPRVLKFSPQLRYQIRVDKHGLIRVHILHELIESTDTPVPKALAAAINAVHVPPDSDLEVLLSW